MEHSFDIEIAKKYSINISIFLKNISFWILKNQANERHFYDGRYWTYNSLDAFVKLFPYWTKKIIRTVIEKCKDEGLIVQGSYNKSPFDKTAWYALTHVGLPLFPTLNSMETRSATDVPKWAHPRDQKGTPIPYINTDIKHTTMEKSGEGGLVQKKTSTSVLDDDTLKILKKYEIKTPKNLTSVHKNYIEKAINLLSDNEFTLDDYLNYLTNRCPRALLPYNTNGIERQNGFGNILRPSFINDVLNGKWKD
jgi:hypothetical protein